ncbi:MAG TPA: DUF4097 family beta strand repeat-containing protein [Blastocatellia bacterium]|nr:DUF4097 family beta strand repeat-containing protein [Blastocatellia bacterium]
MNRPKPTTRGHFASLFQALLLVFITAATVAAQTSSQNRAELHETYNLNPGGTVSVSNVSGYIHVTGWDENRVKVDAVKRPQRGNDDLDKVEIQVLTSPDRVEIRTIYPRNWRGPGISVDYDLRVPRSANLNSLSSVSGDITVSGVSARVVARSTSGSILAQSVGGDANLSTTSGNITAGSIKGALTINSTSGNLQINDLSSHLNAHNTSGWIRAAEVRDDANVSSTSGGVRLERVGGRVGARSVSGTVFVTDVAGDVDAGSTSDTVTVEKIKGRVTASTVSGRIIARDVQEGVRTNTVSGSIEITSVRGGIGADSTSGSILLRDVESEEVRVHSHSGSVRFQGRVSRNGRYDFDSFSGEILILLPADTDFDLLAKTASGEIETDFPVQVRQGTTLGSFRRRLQATHGKGGAQLNLTGFSASIRLKRQ